MAPCATLARQVLETYDLGLAETTVKAHVSEVLRKLGVVSRTQAVIEVARLDFEAVKKAPR